MACRSARTFADARANEFAPSWMLLSRSSRVSCESCDPITRWYRSSAACAWIRTIDMKSSKLVSENVLWSLIGGCLLLGGGVTATTGRRGLRSEEHTSELQSREKLVCRLLLEKKKTI